MQTILNPREGVNAITLRSEKELPDILTPQEEPELTKESNMEVQVNSKPLPMINAYRALFPSRLSKSKKEDHEKEVIDMFRKVEINILLIDMIKQVPRYAKFLKELCTNKHKL